MRATHQHWIGQRIALSCVDSAHYIGASKTLVVITGTRVAYRGDRWPQREHRRRLLRRVCTEGPQSVDPETSQNLSGTQRQDSCAALYAKIIENFEALLGAFLGVRQHRLWL